jgi:hypothetical protein
MYEHMCWACLLWKFKTGNTSRSKTFYQHDITNGKFHSQNSQSKCKYIKILYKITFSLCNQGICEIERNFMFRLGPQPHGTILCTWK